MSHGGTGDHTALAIDIGGTKVDCALVASDGSITKRQRIDVRDHPDNLYEAIEKVATDFVSLAPGSVIGVACPGPLNDNGRRVSPINIPQWVDFPLLDKLEMSFGSRVTIAGDVQALALAEGHYGAAREMRNYFSLVVSTGVGGAIVMNGKLLEGDSGNAGHLGHLTVVPEGHLCSCGSRGCLEAEASGWAIERDTGAGAEKADAATKARCATLVGRAIGTLAAVMDINHCFVSGSVARGFGDDFFRTATTQARAVAGLSFAQHVTVAPSGLGETGSLLGAALVGWGL
jgi:glucokinase